MPHALDRLKTCQLILERREHPNVKNDEFIRQSQARFRISIWICAEEILVYAVIDYGRFNTIECLHAARVEGIRHDNTANVSSDDQSVHRRQHSIKQSKPNR